MRTAPDTCERTAELTQAVGLFPLTSGDGVSRVHGTPCLASP